MRNVKNEFYVNFLCFNMFIIKMKDLSKVNSSQIFEITKNISISLLTIIGVVVGSELLVFYFSPIVGLIGSALLYSALYNNKIRKGANCMLIPYAVFFSLIAYSFVSILANVVYIWGWIHLPDEFSFFNDPYFPTLWLVPITFITLLVVYLRRQRLQLCVDCRLQNGAHSNRGIFGVIINRESRFQLKNLLWLFGLLSIIIWSYYIVKYHDFGITAKDRYIFFWIVVLTVGFDVLYFLYRYFNLYLDLKENDELLTPEDLNDMTGKTYIRYYVICGNDIYLTVNDGDASNPSHFGIDTPFFTIKNDLNVTNTEALQTIQKMTGTKDGELRFFYGRRTPDIDKHKVLRFFYFLNGKPEDYKDIHEPGEWMDFEEMKKIYSLRPDLLSRLTLSDLNRLATIIVTNKTYKENGQRRMKLKTYRPTFDLVDVRNSDLDFHDDKWLRIAVYNADNRFFRFKRWWNRITNIRNKSSVSQ